MQTSHESILVWRNGDLDSVLFVASEGDTTAVRVVMPTQMYEDMEFPEKITVTVLPGDHMNPVVGEETP